MRLLLRQRAGKNGKGYSMIIQAADRFVCAHCWVATATATGDRWLLVCEGCGHRTDELPLTKLDREMRSIPAQVYSHRR